MKIDTGSIEGYSEMTAEQKLAALEAFEYEDNASEVERLKNAVSKANSEAADWKKKHNALLSDDEQKKQESAETLKKMTEELENLRKEKTISDFTAKYIALGYEKSLAESTAKAMADGDMDTVFKNGETHKSNLEKKIKEELMNKTPKPVGSGGKEDTETDKAVEKAKEIMKSRRSGGKEYDDIMSKYKK